MKLGQDSAALNIDLPEPDLSPDREARLRARLSKSATGKRMLDFADSRGIKIIFDERLPEKTGGYFLRGDPDSVHLNPLKRDEALVSTLCHELRHAEQRSLGLFRLSDSYRKASLPAQVAYLRTLEADADAVATQAVSELVDAGDTAVLEPFRHKRWEMYDAYRAARGDGPDAGLRAAYDAWYSPRISEKYVKERHVIRLAGNGAVERPRLDQAADASLARDLDTALGRFGPPDRRYLAASGNDLLTSPKYTAGIPEFVDRIVTKVREMPDYAEVARDPVRLNQARGTFFAAARERLRAEEAQVAAR